MAFENLTEMYYHVLLRRDSSRLRQNGDKSVGALRGRVGESDLVSATVHSTRTRHKRDENMLRAGRPA